MFRKDSALTRAGCVRAVTVSTVSALALTFAASQARADKPYSQSNHLTAKEQKKVGPACITLFSEAPPFGPQTPDGKAALYDLGTYREHLTCVLKLIAIRQGGDISNLNQAFPQ